MKATVFDNDFDAYFQDIGDAMLKSKAQDKPKAGQSANKSMLSTKANSLVSKHVPSILESLIEMN